MKYKLNINKLWLPFSIQTSNYFASYNPASLLTIKLFNRIINLSSKMYNNYVFFIQIHLCRSTNIKNRKRFNYNVQNIKKKEHHLKVSKRNFSSNTKLSNKLYIPNEISISNPFKGSSELNEVNLKKITCLNNLFKYTIKKNPDVVQPGKIKYDKIINNPIFFKANEKSFEFYINTKLLPSDHNISKVLKKNEIIKLLKNIFDYSYNTDEPLIE